MIKIKYMGSKNKFAKDIIPIIESYITENTKGYLEPFVGGANIIDKVKCSKKIGCDIHKYLIALFEYIQLNDNIPLSISENEYNNVKQNKDKYPDWYVGLVGFCASYNAKWFGGYAGNCMTKTGIRKYDEESIRNLIKQSPNLKDIKFINKSFLDLPIDKIKNYVIYCDIPYKNTTTYKTDTFPYEKFYKWAITLSKDNIVLISEYTMPDEFECIWEKDYKTTLDKNSRSNRTEKLFKVR